MSRAKAFHFMVTVECDDSVQAEQVINERIDYDEDYGFEYLIEWSYMPETDEEAVVDDEIEEHEITLSEADAAKLQTAKMLIESTEFWEQYASHDMDFCLNMAHYYINETLRTAWWK